MSLSVLICWECVDTGHDSNRQSMSGRKLPYDGYEDDASKESNDLTKDSG